MRIGEGWLGWGRDGGGRGGNVYADDDYSVLR